jgi:serine protease inhibitor
VDTRSARRDHARRAAQPKVLTAVGSHLSEQEIDLSLPRWDFGTTIPLMPELRKIGLTDLSNFGGISDSGLSLSDAIHRANITVDEQGTEAGAVTGTAFIAVCGRCGPPAVRADHPFAFAIVHRPTKTRCSSAMLPTRPTPPRPPARRTKVG